MADADELEEQASKHEEAADAANEAAEKQRDADGEDSLLG
jgi:hypothetical protein